MPVNIWVGFIFFLVIYFIWQDRNNRIHKVGHPRPTDGLKVALNRMFREKLFTYNGFKKHVVREPSLIPLL